MGPDQLHDPLYIRKKIECPEIIADIIAIGFAREAGIQVAYAEPDNIGSSLVENAPEICLHSSGIGEKGIGKGNPMSVVTQIVRNQIQAEGIDLFNEVVFVCIEEQYGCAFHVIPFSLNLEITFTITINLPFHTTRLMRGGHHGMYTRHPHHQAAENMPYIRIDISNLLIFKQKKC